VGGYIYDALNRGNGRGTIFHKQAEYQAFGKEKGTQPAVFGTALAPGEFVCSTLRWRYASGMMLA
jgi:hypothetical protein